MDIVHTFRTVKSRDERNNALSALILCLDPYELRHVQGLLQHTTFHYDIVGNLPVEIVAQVFRYIDPVALHQLQRVSRSWNRLLRSPEVVKDSLCFWYGHPMTQTSGNGGAATAPYRNKVEQIARFRTARPYSHVSLLLPDFGHDLALSEDTLAWVSHDLRAIHLWNLRDGCRRKVYGEARESIRKFTLCKELLAFVTSMNVCYVKLLDDSGQGRKFRLHNADMFQSIHCDGRTVVCGGTFGTRAEVYIWNFDNHTGKTLSVNLDEPPLSLQRTPSADNRRQFSLVLNAHRKEIHVLSANFCRDNGVRNVNPPVDGRQGASLLHATFDLAGEQVGQGSCSFDDIIGYCIHKLLPVDRHGRYALRIYGRSLGRNGKLGDYRMFPLEYDTVAGKFTRNEHWTAWKSNPDCSWWNNIFFSTMSTSNWPDREAAICLGSRGRPMCHRLDGQHQGDQVSDGHLIPFNTSRESSVLVNDNWAVHINRSRVRNEMSGLLGIVTIFCYEKDMHPMGLSPTDAVIIRA